MKIKCIPILLMQLLLLYSERVFSDHTNGINNQRCNKVFTISPYLGMDTDKLVTLTLYNQDFKLLEQRFKIEKQKPDVLKSCKPGFIEVSGMASVLFNSPMNIQLNNVEFDFASHLNDWFTTFFDLAYSDPPPTLAGNLGDSNIYLDRIFVIIGNLEKLPFYTTIGRKYVPFGQYYSYMISGSLAQTIEKTEAGSILIGYHDYRKKGLYGSVYALKGVNKLFWDSNQSTVTGFTIGYDFSSKAFNVDIGFDYIQSIAVTQAFQTIPYQKIPGIDLHIKTSIKNFSLVAEFTKATRSFNTDSLSYNNQNSQPAAENIEISYKINKSSLIALGYGKSYQSVFLNIPRQSLNAEYNLSLSDWALLATQYQHNINYPAWSMGNSLDSNFSASNMLLIKLTLYF